MTSLQEKIDTMFQQRPITHKEVNKALQEFRDALMELVCEDELIMSESVRLFDVLALLGTKDNL